MQPLIFRSSYSFTLTLLAALVLGCGGAEDSHSAKTGTSETPASSGEKATTDNVETSSSEKKSNGVSLSFVRGPLKLYEKGKLAITIDANGAVTQKGKPAGVFGKNGEYTNSKGEFGMAYQADGTLLRNDRTPFWGKLNQDGNYVAKSGTWSFNADGTFLINGMPMGDTRVEGVTPETYAFAMAVMVAVIHPAAEAVVY